MKRLMLTLLCAGPLAAQSATTDWTALRTLPVDTPILVRNHSPFLNRCAFSAANEQVVSCHVDARSWLFGTTTTDRTYLRDDVRWITRPTNKARLILTFTGIAGGAALGATANRFEGNRGTYVVIDGALLGFLGYGLGSLVDRFNELFPRHPLYIHP